MYSLTTVNTEESENLHDFGDITVIKAVHVIPSYLTVSNICRPFKHILVFLV